MIEASCSWLVARLHIRGVKDIRFNSILAHIINQWFLDRAINVEEANTVRKRGLYGGREDIKYRGR